MADFPIDCRYTNSHEWARVEEADVVIVGISDHAQQLLGDLVFVELPEEGIEVKAGDEIGVIESVKAASDFFAPISGEIIEVNETLIDAPSLVNNDPYGDGWLVKICPSDIDEMEDLLDAEDYSEQVSEE